MVDGLQREPLSLVVRRESSVPSAIAEIGSTFMYGGSNLYNRLYGVRINEWRTINQIAIHPGIIATRVSEKLGLDPAVVSRSVAKLLDTGLVGVEHEQGSRRLYLTQRGVEVHTGIVPIVQRRAAALLDGFTEEEAQTLLAMLRRIRGNLPTVREIEGETLALWLAGELDGES